MSLQDLLNEVNNLDRKSITKGDNPLNRIKPSAKSISDKGSFANRRQAENNRRIIKSYRYSKQGIGGDFIDKTSLSGEKQVMAKTTIDIKSAKDKPISSPPPSSRKYDPFS